MTAPTSDRRARPAYAWRVVDIVVAAVLAVACGLIFTLWSASWSVMQVPFAAFPPAGGLLTGGWVIAGPLAGLIIRKPGAALFCELLAAVIEAALGSQFGLGAVFSGLLQGAGAELAFALFAYRRFTLPVGLLSGALAGLALGIHEAIIYYAEWATMWKVVFFIATTISGALIAGLVSWLAMKAVAKTGALSAFAAGRSNREV
ncbi:ECF transporter S component [Brevibacterium sp. BRM-1]|uniref:ECF transporter S component n=1 Tax=Brevibacterium sp. BRM-1 TaxID=2999062 RepID=UPI00227E8877|nr:ECF transporter S component [Brevibacterium sp. BRM-1]WAL39080.1 ECF transporter S component [Brevibacterium sp. BRM-1]